MVGRRKKVSGTSRIRHQESGLILFTGKVFEPENSSIDAVIRQVAEILYGGMVEPTVIELPSAL